jgi:hypothetical protein
MPQGLKGCQNTGEAAMEDTKKLAHGHRTDFHLMSNARMVAAHSYRRVPNWVFAMKLFGTGSSSAYQICRDAGIDPDGFKVEKVES